MKKCMLWFVCLVMFCNVQGIPAEAPEISQEELARQAELAEQAVVAAKDAEQATIRALYDRLLTGDDLNEAEKDLVYANMGWLEPRRPGGSVDNAGGPDAFGYRYVDNVAPDTATYNWIELKGDPSATWLPSTAFSSMDAAVNNADLPIGFTFPFYGGSYTIFRVSVDGNIQFVPTYSTGGYSTCIPNGSVVRPAIMPFMDDLYLTRGGITTGNNVIGYRNFTGYTVIQFDSIGRYSTTDRGSFNYQAILFPDGKIKVQVRRAFFQTANADSAHAIGIQQGGSTNPALQYVCDRTGYSLGGFGLDSTINRAIWFFQLFLTNDFGTTSLVTPSPTGIHEPSSVVTVSAMVKNFGSTTESSPVYYSFNGGAAVGPETSPVLSTNQSGQVTFATQLTLPATPGIYPLKVYTNLATDGDRGNDTLTVNLNVNYCYDTNLGSALPVNLTGETTCGMVDNYFNTCLGSYDGGEDQVYRWEVTTAGEYTIRLNPGTTTYTGIAIDDECPPAATCIAYHTQSTATPHGITCLALNPGVYYIMVDTYPSPYCIPDYSLTIEVCLPCDSIPLCGTPAETEPNNTCATFDAYVLSHDDVIYARHCPEADSDWYRVMIPPMNQLTLDLFDGTNCTVSPSTTVRYKVADAACSGITGPYTGPRTYLNCTNDPLTIHVMVYETTTPARTAYKLTTTCTTNLYCGTPTETEPNNTCATYDAYELDCTNNVVYGLHCPASDSDFFKITIPPGTHAVIKAYVGTGCNVNPPNTNIYTQLYTTDCTPVGSAGTSNKTVNYCHGTVDTTVYLLVKNYGTTTQYTGPYKIEVVCGTAPTNDLCENAIPVAIGSSTIGNTFCTTVDNAPICDNYNPATSGPGVWYTFVGNNDLIQVGTCNPNTPLDTKVNVYSGDCANLVCVTGDDDDCTAPGLASLDTVCALAGVTYYVLVYNYSTGTVSNVFQLDLVDLGVPCDVGRCCYGDVTNPSCMDTTAARCTELGGAWTFGLNCTANPCPVCVVDQSVTAPGQWTGTTAGDDCDLRTGADYMFEVTIPYASTWTFSLCNTSLAWDTYLYLSQFCCNGYLYLNDDYCGAVSEINCVSLTAGTYYLDVEPYSTSYSGAFVLDVYDCACQDFACTYTIEEVYANLSSLVGRWIYVFCYTTPSDLFVGDFAAYEANTPLPENVIMTRAGSVTVPDSLNYGAAVLAGGIVGCDSTRLLGYCLTIQVDTLVYLLPAMTTSVLSPCLLQPLEPCDSCKFAIFISGGVDSDNNHADYYNDLKYWYQYKRNIGYCSENIKVFYYEGSRPPGDTTIPAANVQAATTANIQTAVNDISRKVKACETANPGSSEVEIMVTNHGDPSGICLLGDSVFITPEQFTAFKQTLVDSGLSKLDIEQGQCFGGNMLEEPGFRPGKCNVTESSAADDSQYSYSERGQNGYNIWLNAKREALSSGLPLPQAIQRADSLYNQWLKAQADSARAEAQRLGDIAADTTKPDSVRAKAILEQLEWLIDAGQYEMDANRQMYVHYRWFSGYCKMDTIKVPRGGAVKLKFSGDSTSCGNCEVWELDGQGKIVKRLKWNWTIPGSRYHVAGGDERWLHADSNSTGIFIVKNNDSTWSYKVETWPVDHESSPSNEATFSGFSEGGWNDSPAEFGYPAGPVVVVNEGPGLNLYTLPAEMSPGGVSTLQVNYEILEQNYWWSAMQWYARFLEVEPNTGIRVQCENALVPDDTLYVSDPGEYAVNLGAISGTGTHALTLTLLSGSVTFDNWALRTTLSTGFECELADSVAVYVCPQWGPNPTLHFYAPRDGNYWIFSTTDRNLVFSPVTWLLEADLPVLAGWNHWMDPAAPVSYKRYVVVHLCE
ncbi:hypothetical protein KKH27_10605 [bacterium]|nr:hypothetical protein [bacterium]MBU1985035.1 hypothetical protein [bacterium]